MKKSFSLIMTLALLSTVITHASVSDEIAAAKKKSPPAAEMKVNNLVMSGLQKALKDKKLSVTEVEYERWHACALNMEANLASVRLSDGRVCWMSIHAWFGFYGRGTIQYEGALECYKDNSAVSGYTYEVGFNDKNKMTVAKATKANSSIGNVCDFTRR